MRITLAAAVAAVGLATAAPAAVVDDTVYSITFTPGPTTIMPTARTGATMNADLNNQMVFGGAGTQVGFEWQFPGTDLDLTFIALTGDLPGGTFSITGLMLTGALLGVSETSDPGSLISNAMVTGADSFSFDFAGLTATANNSGRLVIDVEASAPGVPLPAPALLLVAGLAGIAALRRRA